MATETALPGWITASQVFAVFTLIVCYLVGIPLIIYCLKTFYFHQRKPYFLKRNIKLFWVFSGILIIYILICAPMEALSSRGHLIEKEWYSPFATVMIQGIVVSALLLSNMARFWYIFVQIRVSQERAEWKKILNPNYESWVEKYYKYIANWKYIVLLNVIIPLSLLIIIVCAVGFGGETGSETWAGRTLMGFIFFCAICQLLLFYLMRFVDYWYIRDEFRKYFYFFGIGFLLILIVSGSALITDFNLNKNKNGSIGYFNYEYITFIACTLFLFYFFYATKVIIVRNEYRSKKYKMKQKSYQNRINKLNKIKNGDTLSSKFRDFVSKKEGYCEMMQHITREFSTENLLFLTVLTHFQHFLIEFGYFRDDFLLIQRDSFDIPDDIPKPPIIESQTKKLRDRYLKELHEKNKEKEINQRRSKSQTDLLHINNIKKSMSSSGDKIVDNIKPKRFSLHIKRNSDSLKKEALKQIFAITKRSSFKKLNEGTPSQSFDDPTITQIKVEPSKLSLTSTQSVEREENDNKQQQQQQQEEITNTNNNKISPNLIMSLTPLRSVSSADDRGNVSSSPQIMGHSAASHTLSASKKEEEEEEEEEVQFIDDDDDDEDDDDDDVNAVIMHKVSINNKALSNIKTSKSKPSINTAMTDLSPLPMSDEEDNFEHNLDFSALIPIYDTMYRRFIVRGSAPMEINISYACAAKLMSSHRKMMSSHRYGMALKDWKELFLNLKDAGKQTLRLLHDSYSRFKFQTNLLDNGPNTTYLE